MTKILLIAAGGAFGSVSRYAVHGWLSRWAGESFPFGTLAVNLLGCLLIGVLAAAFAGPFPVREEYRLALTVGVLGGFTTFSAFGLETFRLADQKQHVAALAYVSVSVILGIAAVWLGYRAAERLFGA